MSSRLEDLRNGGDDKDDRIRSELSRRPGALTKDIAAATGIGIFSCRYRLLTLEAAGAIYSKKTRNRVHYYLHGPSVETANEGINDVSNDP